MPISLPDPHNDDLLIYVGGELLPREDAKVSVFDSVVQGGDAVWEGLRVYDGRIFELDAPLNNPFDIRNTRSIEWIIQGGVVLKPDSLLSE